MSHNRYKYLILLTGLIILLLNTPAIAEIVSVSVRNTQLRPKEDFLARGSSLKYGDQLVVLGKNSGWLKVKTLAGQEGYVHSSAITDRGLNLTTNKSKVRSQGTGKEVVLASKGFDKNVESQFSAQNKSFDFKAVDQMEKTSVSDSEVLNFIKEGKLK